MMGLIESIERTVEIYDLIFKHNLNLGIPGVLMIRSRSSQIAASSLIISGQLFESNPVLRQSLECSGYGFLMKFHPHLRKVWTQREESREKRNVAKIKIGISNVFNAIESKSKIIKNEFKTLYNLCVDRGAHPNFTGIINSTEFKKIDDSDKVYWNNIILSGDEDYIKRLLLMNYRVGVVNLLLFRLMEPEKFMLLGASQQVDEELNILRQMGYYK